MRQSKNPEYELGSPGLPEQKRACPLCDEVKTLRGLYGHLRLKHGKEGNELAGLASNAIVDSTDSCVEVLRLMSQLRQLWNQLDMLDALAEQNCFESGETRDALRASLHAQVEDVLDALQERGIVFSESETISAVFSSKNVAPGRAEGREDR